MKVIVASAILLLTLLSVAAGQPIFEGGCWQRGCDRAGAFSQGE